MLFNSDDSCKYQPFVQDGSISRQTDAKGEFTKMDVSCDQGFKPNGPTSLNCAKGEWDQSVPSCTGKMSC